MEESTLKGTERSSRYPAINIDFAIKVITEARVFGRNITNNHIAGKGIPKGGGFIRKKAALGYYGLLSGRSGKLHVSDLAESIIYPKDEAEKKIAMQKSFLSPDLFNKLYSDTEKNAPIDLELLGNLIIRQYGIIPSSKREFLSTFISSGIYVGLVEYSEDKKSIILKDSSVEDALNDKQLTEDIKEDTVSVIPKELEAMPADSQRIEIALEKGKAFILVPTELTEGDIKKLIAQIKILGNDFT